MIFSKKTTRVVSIPKLGKFIVALGKYRPKTLKNGYFCQKWPNFDHFWPFLGIKKFFNRKNIWWSSKSYGDTTSCKKLENKRAMLGSLGGGQINKKQKNGGGQSKSFKNDNNR